MRRVRGKANLSGWNLEGTKDELLRIMEPLILFGVSQAMENVIDGSGTFLFMPAIWGDSDEINGPPPDDPLTLRIQFGIGDESNEPVWETTLREYLNDKILDCSIDGSWSEGLERIMLSLRELADEIKQAIQEGKSET